ncbi:hypothetical protein [Zoogloea sp.]|uniref:hypothetical protein n=1 Tax=Zoogloea sp. TaxID=49181 RepID=UPI0035B48FF7
MQRNTRSPMMKSESLRQRLSGILGLALLLGLALNAQAATKKPATSRTSSATRLGGVYNPSVNGTDPAQLKRPTQTMCAINSQAHKRQAIKFSYQEASGRLRSAQNDRLGNQPTGDLYADCDNRDLLIKSGNIGRSRQKRGGKLFVTQTNMLTQPQPILGAPPVKTGAMYDQVTGQLRPPNVLRKYQIYQQD